MTAYYSFGNLSNSFQAVGGIAFSVYSISFFIVEGYQIFSYQKSSFKLLFFEDSNEPEEFHDKKESYSYAGRQGLSPRSELRR